MGSGGHPLGKVTSARPPEFDVESRIKDAAILVVAEEGLSGLSVRAICARAGVSEARFRRCWSDAWAAMLDALDERTTLPRLPDEGSLVGDLGAYALAYYERCSDPVFTAFMFKLLAATKSDPGVRRKFSPDFVKRRARNRVMIERAVARGELAANVDGDAILDAVLGLGLCWLGKGKAPCRREIGCAIARLIAAAQNPDARASEARSTSETLGGYRLYLFEPPQAATLGRTAQVHHVGSHSDDQAIEEANERRGGRYAELWKRDRLLMIFSAEH
jgi:AcrR family transcriptional regulator